MIEKPKLTPQSTRMFLELAAKYIEERISNPYKSDTAIQLVSDFTKKMIVSKAYRACSSVAYYDIYRVSLGIASTWISLTVTHKDYAHDHTRHTVTVSFEFVCKMFKLLKPAYVELITHEYGAFVDVRDLLDMLSDTNVNVSMRFDHDFDVPRARALLDYYAHMIHQLYCNIDVLNTEKVYPFTKLEVLMVKRFKNSGQIVHALKYSVRELVVNFDILAKLGNIEHELGEVRNYCVKILSIGYSPRYSDFGQAERLVFTVRNCCPDVLDFNTKIFVSTSVNQARVYDTVSQYFERVKALKESVSNTFLAYNVQLFVDLRHVKVTGEFDLINTVRNSTKFSGWKIECHREEIMFPGATHRDTLNMELMDSRGTLLLNVSIIPTEFVVQ